MMAKVYNINDYIKITVPVLDDNQVKLSEQLLRKHYLSEGTKISVFQVGKGFVIRKDADGDYTVDSFGVIPIPSNIVKRFNISQGQELRVLNSGDYDYIGLAV